MATKSESDRTAERGQWTLKSRFLTTETQNAIRLAAAKAGAPIGDWCVRVLYHQARAELGKPIAKPLPPARLEEVVAEGLDKLWERQQAELAQIRQESEERDRQLRAEREEREQKLREEQAAALRASEERMGQLVSELAREGRRGRWRR